MIVGQAVNKRACPSRPSDLYHVLPEVSRKLLHSVPTLLNILRKMEKSPQASCQSKASTGCQDVEVSKE